MLYLITYLRTLVSRVFICICSERIICSLRIMYLYSLASLLQGTACQYLNAPCVPGKDVPSAAECSIYATSVLTYDPVMYYSVPLLFLHSFKALCCFQFICSHDYNINASTVVAYGPNCMRSSQN